MMSGRNGRRSKASKERSTATVLLGFAVRQARRALCGILFLVVVTALAVVNLEHHRQVSGYGIMGGSPAWSDYCQGWPLPYREYNGLPNFIGITHLSTPKQDARIHFFLRRPFFESPNPWARIRHQSYDRWSWLNGMFNLALTLLLVSATYKFLFVPDSNRRLLFSIAAFLAGVSIFIRAFTLQNTGWNAPQIQFHVI